MRRFTWYGLLLMGIIMVLSACAGGSEDKGSSKEEKENTESEAKSGGDLVLAVLSDASTLDPAGSNDVPSHNMQEPIFERLVKRDEDAKIIPGLAKEWSIVDDTTHEFKLEEGVKFHDGEPFNADAVKISIERLIDPEIASPKYDNFAMIEGVEVIDEYTVHVKTKYPFAPILAHLSHTGASIISPKVIEEDYKKMEAGEKAGTVISANPVGTGPFKFDSWTPGEEVKYVNNADYWGEKALVDTATIKVIPESGTRNAELERGFAHIVNPVQPSEVPELEAGGFAEVIKTQSTGLAYIGFNMDKEPFNDVRVRKAVSMAINKQEVTDGVYDGYGLAGEGPLAPKVFGYSEDIKGIGYDMDEAKKLMEEAGLADGFEATIWTNDNPQRMDTAVILQNALKELNVDLKIEQMEFGSYLEKLKSGEHDMFILGWTNPLIDADNGLYSLFHSTSMGVPPNAMWYGNEQVDELLDKGRQEMDEEKRLALYKEVQEIIVEDAPMIFLDYQVYLTAVSNDVKGFRIDSGGIYHIEKVEFVK